jgi:hypothetical protein
MRRLGRLASVVPASPTNTISESKSRTKTEKVLVTSKRMNDYRNRDTSARGYGWQLPRSRRPSFTRRARGNGPDLAEAGLCALRRGPMI